MNEVFIYQQAMEKWGPKLQATVFIEKNGGI